MKLIVISPAKTTENEIRTVIELFEHGLETYHLRKPTMHTKEMRQYLDKIPAHFHNRIVIHSHHKLAGTYGLKGIHLTGLHLKRKFSTWFRLRLLKMKNPELTISTTFHKIAHVYGNKRQFDYVFMGTIFDAVAGKFNAGYSEHSLRAAIQKANFPILARGGTSQENIPVCQQIGFGGMVFYTAIWKHENPVDAFCQLLGTFRGLNIPVE